jgi:hypothetical protein
MTHFAHNVTGVPFAGQMLPPFVRKDNGSDQAKVLIAS